MIQICSGITSGRVLNGELYAQRLQKLIYLHLLTGCFYSLVINSAFRKSLGREPPFTRNTRCESPTLNYGCAIEKACTMITALISRSISTTSEQDNT